MAVAVLFSHQVSFEQLSNENSKICQYLFAVFITHLNSWIVSDETHQNNQDNKSPASQDMFDRNRSFVSECFSIDRQHSVFERGLVSLPGTAFYLKDSAWHFSGWRSRLTRKMLNFCDFRWIFVVGWQDAFLRWCKLVQRSSSNTCWFDGLSDETFQMQ